MKLEQSRYECLSRLTEIFSVFSIGSLTKRDDLTVGFSQSDISQKIQKLSDQQIGNDQIVQEFGVRISDNDGWDLNTARAHVRSPDFDPRCIREINWRPFEKRWIAYDDTLIARTNRRVLSHLESGANVALISVRQLANLPFVHAFVSSSICDQHIISTRTREGGVVFPLLLKGDGRENLAPAFRTFLDTRYEHPYTPEEILGYIYAVLHAPAYRTRYAEFLRIDFPRIPFPETAAHFESVSKLGWALVQAHLLRDLPRHKLAAYHGKGAHDVEAVRYAPADGSLWINKTQCFRPIPQNVWDFHIGGYQVLDKYLKSRKGRTLSLDEINNVAAIASSLEFTVAQMAKIDAAYTAAFPDRG